MLEPGDLIVALRLPADAGRFSANQRYLKLRERTSFAFALVSAAAALDIVDGKIRSARLSLGAVAAKPWRARDAEALLQGSAPSVEAFEQAARAALADAMPSSTIAFKIELARRTVNRALLLAAAGTPEKMPAMPGSAFSSVPGIMSYV